MRKFTIFTVFLTIIVIVAVVEVAADRYIPAEANITGDLSVPLPTGLDLSKTIMTDITSDSLSNKLGSDLDPTYLDVPAGAVDDVGAADLSDPTSTSISRESVSFPTDTSSGIQRANTNPSADPTVPVLPPSSTDFEDVGFAAPPSNVYIRDEQLRNAGFTGATIFDSQYDGQYFKTIFTGDLTDVDTSLYLIKSDSETLAKVYIFSAGISTSPDEVYQKLKSKSAEDAAVTINETNEFGSNSFYMNDERRAQSVFMTVRIGSLVYGFSYPKKYHSQIKNLIQLIEWELG